MAKYLSQNNLKQGKVYLGAWSPRLQYVVPSPHHSGSLARLNIMAGSAWWSKAGHLIVARSRERWSREGGEEEEEKEEEVARKHAPRDLLAQSRPQLLKFPVPPNSPDSHESINRLIHRSGQSPHDPAISPGPTSEHCCPGNKALTHEIWWDISDPNHTRTSH